MFEKSRKSSESHRKSSKTIEQSDPFRATNHERSKKEANLAVQICRKFLKVLGVWRLNDDGKFSFLLVLEKLLPIIWYYGLGIRTIPTILFMFIVSRDLVQICLLFGRVLFCLMAWSKYVFLRYYQEDIAKCMKDIELDWLAIDNPGSREIMLEYSRYGMLVTKVCAVFTLTGATWRMVMCDWHWPHKAVATIVDNETIIVAPVRLFTVPSYFGFSFVLQTPFYEIIYMSQAVATYLLYWVAVASYSVAVVTVVHACGQLKILMEKIEVMIDGNDDKMENGTVDTRLADIVRQHVRILRFISSAEKMLREICLIDLGGCTIEICLVGYFLIVEFGAEHKNFSAIIVYVTLMIMFTFNIFSFCFIGELLTQECQKVGEIAYMIDWYRLPGKQPLALCLIMAMAHNPVTLTAGGAIQLSYRCFASVVNTSVGYLNMLRAVMD